MLAKLGRFIVVLTLLCTLGAPWTLLQSVAWMRMTWSFAQTAPLGEALTKTFDGKHPCKLCKLVQQGRKTERKQGVRAEAGKLDLYFDARPVVLSSPSLAALPRWSVPLPELLGLAPPFPPPRILPG